MAKVYKDDPMYHDAENDDKIGTCLSSGSARHERTTKTKPQTKIPNRSEHMAVKVPVRACLLSSGKDYSDKQGLVAFKAFTREAVVTVYIDGLCRQCFDLLRSLSFRWRESVYRAR